MTNDKIRQHKVDQLSTRSLDLHGRRFTNAGNSVGKQDYVTKGEVESATTEAVHKSYFNRFLSAVSVLSLRIIASAKDAVDGLKITKSDRSTAVVTVDTLNSKVGIGTEPDAKLELMDGYFRIIYGADNPPTANSGLELSCRGGTAASFIVSYDRTGAAFIPLSIVASELLVSGTTLLTVTSPVLVLGAVGGSMAFWGGTAATKQTLNAYTTDPENVAYTGLATGLGGSPYASVANLNALRTAYENLRAMVDDMRTKLQNTTLVG